ncbi:MAG: BON domain-containing protein [Acidimicrobiia bacterium]|nr:BON domain-containing protein [Acidimicrobiia bacterium]
MGMFKFLLAAAAGAGVVYLFDPDRGRSRRARLSDQVSARTREGMAKTRQQADYQAGVARGAVHDAVDRITPDDSIDDATLLQKVRSEALGPSGVSTGSVDVAVEDGVVIFRGKVPADGSAVRLVELTSAVEGVTEIRNELTSE